MAYLVRGDEDEYLSHILFNWIYDEFGLKVPKVSKLNVIEKKKDEKSK